MSKTNLEISIVIPVYRSEATLKKLVAIVHSELSHLDFEVILVNDYSPDNSWSIIQSLCEAYDNVSGINLRKNYGQHSAIMAGLQYSSGKTIIIMDDDLQHDPKYITTLHQKILSGYDACFTNYLNRKHQIWKIMGSWFNNQIASILIQKPKDVYLSSFKAISVELKNEIIRYDGPFPYIDGLILNLTKSITTENIEHQERDDLKDSGYGIKKSLLLWMRMATSFSVIPLRIAAFVGFLVSVCSFLLCIYFIWIKLSNGIEISGWTSTIVVILFLGGLQMFFTGIIGEFIGRSYLKLNKVPQYSIREKIGYVTKT
jgi:undecaprenyl-phosphate 4-deoxy-4-formamido-L-arabinose transferase